MKKRFIALLLATTLSVSLASQTIYATELTTENTTPEDVTSERTTGENLEEIASQEGVYEGDSSEEITAGVTTTEEGASEEIVLEGAEEYSVEDEPTEREDFVLPPGGYRDVEEVEIESIYDYPDDYVPRRRGNTALESSYITPNLPNLRDQENYGTCWAHASIALAEINLLKQGKVTETDLSELHLAYFTYNPILDPLGGITDDANGCDPSRNYLDWGGNFALSEVVLANWVGAADETTAPYSDAATVLNNGLSPGLSFNDEAHLTNYYETEFSPTNLAPVKELIKEYGAVGVSFSAQDPYNGGASASVYNKTTNAYYNPTPDATNHSVVIVGWDDSFSKNNFNVTPAGDGAWLVRNSWTKGDYNTKKEYNGYFWMSYYEATLEDRACAFVFDTADNYTNNYQYDGGIRTNTIYGPSTYANVFTAHANGATDGEILKAASFYTSSTNVSYTVDVYTDLTDASNPSSGTLATTATGTTKFAGYYTVPLPQEVSVDANEKFAIVVTLTKAGDTPTIGCEGAVNDWYTSSPSVCAGQSFFYNGANWVDFGTQTGGNLRIKAFTDNAEAANPIEPTSISFGTAIDASGVTIGLGETYHLSPTISPSNATNKKLNWTSSNTSVVTVKNGTLTGVAAGTATVTATAVLGGVSKTINVTVDATKITSLGIGYSAGTTGDGAVAVEKGQTCQFTATPTPASADMTGLQWTSSDTSVLTIDATGKATGVAVGTVTVTASVGNVIQTIQVKVFPQAAQFNAVVADDNTITVTWDAKEGVDAYVVQMYGQEANALKKRVEATVTAEAGKTSYTYTMDYYKKAKPKQNLVVRIFLYSIEVAADDGTYSNAVDKTTFVGPTYTITYQVGKGTNAAGNPTTYKYYRYPNGFQLLDATAPIGYRFAGWYTDASYTNRVESIGRYDSGNKVFYAKYIPNNYTIKYYYNTGTAGSVSQECTYDITATLKSTIEVEKTGYTLVGWNTEADGTGTSYGLGASVKNLCAEEGETYSLYALWQPVAVKVTLDGNGGHVNRGDRTRTVYYDGTYGTLPTPTYTNKTFGGWFTQAEGGMEVTAATVITTTENHTIYAHWTNQTGWITNGRKTYYIDPTTEQKVTGQQTIGGKTYYFDDRGVRKTGWVTVEGKTYYYNPFTGEMQTGWLTVNDVTYYLDATGAKVTGHVQVDEVDYNFSDTGALQNDPVVPDPDPSSDPIITGWHTDDAGNKLYYDENGVAVLGWQEIDGVTYYFDKNGYAVNDFRVVDKKLYYFATAVYASANSGAIEYGLVTNATVIGNGVAFTAGDDGVMSSDSAHWLTLSDGQYYVTAKGTAVTGWLEKGDARYYMSDETGAMVTGAKRIGFRYYYFGTDGKLASAGTTPALPVEGSDETKTYTIRDDGSLVTGWNYEGYIPAPRTSRTAAVPGNTYEVMVSNGSVENIRIYEFTDSGVQNTFEENAGNTSATGVNNGAVTTAEITSANDVQVLSKTSNSLLFVVLLIGSALAGTAVASKRRKVKEK